MSPSEEREAFDARDVDDLAERILKAAQLAHPIYVAHGWTWGGHDTPREIPSVERLAVRLKSLYDTAKTNETGCCSTGRLTVYVDPDDGSIAVDVQLADLRDEVPGWEEAQRYAELTRE